MKKFITILLVIVLIILGIGIVGHYTRHPAQKVTPMEPCTKNACIEIRTGNNISYELNDFRFLPNHCIAFISLPDNTSRNYCGQYQLKWIGPDNTKPTLGA